jgi:hypothetical protein
MQKLLRLIRALALLGGCGRAIVAWGSQPVESAGMNVALASAGAVAISDSDYGGFIASMANDGNWIGPGDKPDANRWHGALGKPHPHWVWIRFRQPARITQAVLHRADIVDYPVDFTGEFSLDGGFTFQTLFAATNRSMTPGEFAITNTFAPVVADNFRLRILRSSHREYPNSAQLSEVEVLGEFVTEVAVPPERPAPRLITRKRLRPGATEGLEIIQHAREVEFRSKWLRLVLSKTGPRIAAMCWDSLGEGRVNENLLKPAPDGGAGLSFMPLFPGSGRWAGASGFSVEVDGNVVRYTQELPGGVPALWEIGIEAKRFQVAARVNVPKNSLAREPVSLKFAFDAGRTPVAPLANPKPGAAAPLPCVLHASDFGSLRVRSLLPGRELCLVGEPVRPAAQWNAAFGQPVKGRALDGLFVPPPQTAQWHIEFSVVSLAPVPELIQSEPRLRALARSWLNTFQYRPDLGILANNIVSDNAVFCMFTFTDPAVFTSPLPDAVEAIQVARESLDRYLVGAAGYGTGMEDILTDTYPSLLISAWDVIRVTGDRKLLRRWLPKLEDMAAKAIAQDRNGNGLPESTRSGLPDTAVCPTANWWDQVNFGHEDAYAGALSCRAFRRLADLERLARRAAPAERYEERAERIRTAYVTNFFNPKTGVLAGWKDAKGELHDYWFVFVNGIAITYGLVPEALSNQIVDRFEAKMREVGYTRFDLGLPGNLVPIAKHDYGKATLGTPAKEDGSDSFGVFENGGASACYAYFYVQALYQLGRRAEAERILWPMVRTFAEGGFQNGVGKGGEWRHWDGRPSGYEGFLADAYYAQMAVFTGHYGIGFGTNGFHLESWSPLKGKRAPLGLKFMGKVVETVE